MIVVRDSNVVEAAKLRPRKGLWQKSIAKPNLIPMQNCCIEVVARERFELSSMAPKATMLDHYTNGLLCRAFGAEVLTTLFFLISILANM